MGRLREIVIDADHPASLARFWFDAGHFTVLRDPEGNQFCVADDK